MLQKIRDRIQGWIAGVIIAIIAAAFMLFGVEYYLERGAGDGKTVATVGGTKISERQVQTVYNQIKRQQETARRGAPLSEQFLQQLKQVALQEVVNTTALVNAATESGFQVSSEQLQQLVMRAPEFQVGGRFSPQRFQQMLYANQMSESQFLNHIRGTLLTNQVALGIQNSEFVLPKELAHSYRLIHQTRNFGYFVLPKSRFESQVKISKKEIESYYKNHKDQFKTPEKVKISYLLLSPKNIEKGLHISRSKMQAYYESNKASYSSPTRWKISRITIVLPKAANEQQIMAAKKRLKTIQDELAKGTSFSTLIKRGATGQVAATSWIREGQASAVLANVLSTLKVKQVSKPFHTSDGINIIQLLAKEPGRVKSFAEVQQQIKQALLGQQAEQILSKKSDQLSNLTYTNPSSLQGAAKALNLPIQSSALLTKRGNKTGLFSNSAILTAAFSDSVLKDGNNSNPITLKDGSFIVLRVSRHVPSSVQAFSQVAHAIKQQLLHKKALAKAGLEAYQIESALAAGKSAQRLADKYGLKWIEKQQVTRNDKSVSSAILASVFTTIPATNKKSAGVNSLLLADGNYIVVKVYSSKKAKFSKASDKARQKLSAALANFLGQINYKLYVKNVIDRTKIHVKKQKT